MRRRLARKLHDWGNRLDPKHRVPTYIVFEKPPEPDLGPITEFLGESWREQFRDTPRYSYNWLGLPPTLSGLKITNIY